MWLVTGGLFKDFFTDLCAQAFDVRYGLFAQTTEGLLYPHPASAMLYAHNGNVSATAGSSRYSAVITLLNCSCALTPTVIDHDVARTN